MSASEKQRKTKNRLNRDARLKQAGLCLKCGVRPAKVGQNTCGCIGEEQKRRHKILLDKGLCVRCGEKPHRVGKQTCECALKYYTDRRKGLQAQGQCTECKELARPGRSLCAGCAEAYVRRQNKQHEERSLRGVCTQCGDDVAGKGDRRCVRCRKKDQDYDKRIRLEVFAHYGSRCECCGETQKQFLTIDHINGGGTKHRETDGIHLHRLLRRDNYPEGFRLLCFNCNCGRYINGGVTGQCPHKTDIYTDYVI